MKNIANYILESKKSVEQLFDNISDVLTYIEPKDVLDALFQYLDVDTFADYYETYCRMQDFDYKEGLRNKDSIYDEFEELLDTTDPTNMLMELLSYMDVDELNDFYDYLVKQYDLED